MRKWVLATAIGLLVTGPMATIGFAEELPANKDLAADEAFVLVNMGARGALKRYVSSLNFSNSSANLDLTVPTEKGFQIIKVKAGTYQPEALGLSHSRQRHQTTNFVDRKADEKSIVIEPGTITYIGQWDVLYGKSITMMGNNYIIKDSAYKVSYPVAKVNGFAQENEWVTQFPLRFSHISGQNVSTSWQHIEQQQYN